MAHAIRRNRQREERSTEEEEKSPVTTDDATAEDVALQRAARRPRAAMMTVRIAAQVAAMSQIGGQGVDVEMSVVIGSVDEKCKHGGSNFRGKIKKGRKNF